MSEVERSQIRAAHGYVLHCAGEVCKVLGAPLGVDEHVESPWRGATHERPIRAEFA